MANPQQNSSENSQNECKEVLNDYSTLSLYNVDEITEHLTGLALATFTPSLDLELYCTNKQIPAENALPDQSSLSISRAMTCSICNVVFANRNEQILHYKLDWHRFNIKLKLQGEKPVPENKFDAIAGDISSLSGSDSSSDDEKSDYDTTGSDNSGNIHHKRPSVLPSHVKVHTRRRRLSSATSTDTETEDGECIEKNVIPRARLQPKLYFKNQIGKIVALYRCVVHGKVNTPQNEHDLLSRVIALPNQMNWAIILVGGGHFAAAVYNQSEIILHKTFHRYTVRAKQGSSQGTRDGKHGGTQPKSAGASLRRYNEAALIKDIQDQLGSWNCELQKCSCIFYRAPSFNRVALFGSKNPPFKKDDFRLRNIPFPTRRATFNEAQRVFRLLSTLECFGERPDDDKTIPQSPKIHLAVKKAKKISNLSSSEKTSETSERSESDKSISQSRKIHVGIKKTKKISNLSSPAKCDKTDEKSKSSNIEKQPRKLIRKIKQENPVALKENKDLSATCTSDSDDSIQFEYVEEHIMTTDLKETDGTYRRKPHRRKGKQRSGSFSKRQQDPSTGMLNDEKCNIKNALFLACRSGNIVVLESLLNILKNESHFSTTDLSILAAKVIDDNICDVKLNQKSTEVDRIPLVQHFDVKDSGQQIQRKENFSEYNEIEKNVSGNHHHHMEQYETLDNNGQSSLKEIGFVLHIPSEYAVLNKESDKLPQKWNKNTGKDNNLQLDILTLKILNDAISDSGATMLHVATKEGHQQIVRLLLEYGADPTARDKRGVTPYMISNNREMRNEYRHFMAENPDKFDYNKAQIPSPLTEEMQKEQMERKKEKKRLKKEKLKEKKAAELQKKLEGDEKNRFLSLSDREKRALAAEKRFMKQLSAIGETSPILSRCFQCGEDITGKIPFEYYNNCFCSVNCVKNHRKDKNHVS